MKKLELSEVTSNMLLASAVLFAIAPLLLGDQLLLLVTSGLREGSLLLDDVFAFFTSLLR